METLKYGKYEVVDDTTQEERDGYWKVKRIYDAMDVANWLDSNRIDVTQEQFDDMCDRLGDVEWGEEVYGVLEYIYDDVIGRSKR